MHFLIFLGIRYLLWLIARLLIVLGKAWCPFFLVSIYKSPKNLAISTDLSSTNLLKFKCLCYSFYYINLLYIIQISNKYLHFYNEDKRKIRRFSSIIRQQEPFSWMKTCSFWGIRDECIKRHPSAESWILYS